MMISHEKKFIFIHIKKTAGWSVYEGLTHIAADGDGLSDDWNNGHCHDTAQTTMEWAGEKIFNSYFKFAFVRNPWDREVSQHFFSNGNHTVDTFRRFITFRSRTISEPPQKRMMVGANGRIIVDFIGRYERIQDDFNKICERLDCGPIKLPHSNKWKHQPYHEIYDEGLVELAKSYLLEDISFFGYKFSGYDDIPGHTGFIEEACHGGQGQEKRWE